MAEDVVSLHFGEAHAHEGVHFPGLRVESFALTNVILRHILAI